MVAIWFPQLESVVWKGNPRQRLNFRGYTDSLSGIGSLSAVRGSSGLFPFGTVVLYPGEMILFVGAFDQSETCETR